MIDLRKLKDKAAEAFTKGKFAKAAESYEEYCAADPKDHQARLRMGDAWAKAGKKEKAIGAYAKAAEGFAKDGFLPRAIAASKLILELDPAHQGVQKMLADLYARKTGPLGPGTGKPAGATALGGEQRAATPSRPDVVSAARKDPIPLDGPAPARPNPAAAAAPAKGKVSETPSPMNRADAIELPEYEVPGAEPTVEGVSTAVPVAAKGPSPTRNFNALEFDEGQKVATGPGPLSATTIDLGVAPTPTAAPPPAPPPAPTAAAAPAEDSAIIPIEVDSSEGGEEIDVPIVGGSLAMEAPQPPPPPTFAFGGATIPEARPSGPDLPIIEDPEPLSDPRAAVVPPPRPSAPSVEIDLEATSDPVVAVVPPPPPKPSGPEVIEAEPISDPMVGVVPPPPPRPSAPEVIEGELLSDPAVAVVPPPPPKPSGPEVSVAVEPISDPVVATVMPPNPRPSIPDRTTDAQLIGDPPDPKPSGPDLNVVFDPDPPQPPPLPHRDPAMVIISESPTVVVSPLVMEPDDRIVRSGEGDAPPGLRAKPRAPEPKPVAPRIYLPQPGGSAGIELQSVASAAVEAQAPAGGTSDLERSLEIFSRFDTEDFLAPAAAVAPPPPPEPLAPPPPPPEPAAPVEAAAPVRKARSFTELELDGDSLLHAVEEAAVVGLHQRGQADALLAAGVEELMEAPDELKTAAELGGALPKIPLFSELPEDAFIALFERCPLKRINEGELVFQQGSLGDAFYVICAGAVRVFRTEGERRRDLATLEEGAFFGEMALLAGSPRTASVEGKGEDTQLLEISAAILSELSHRHPQVATALKKFCRQRLLSNVMATAPLFQPFSRQDRRELVQRFRARDVHRGEVLIREGTASDGMYVILSGEVEVRVQGAIVATLKEGEVFGEMSLLTKSKATATVAASKRTSLLRLPREDFDMLIMSHPQVLVLVSDLTEARQKQNAAIASQRPPSGDAAPMV